MLRLSIVVLSAAALGSCSSLPFQDGGALACSGKKRPVNVSGSVLPGGPAPVDAAGKPDKVSAETDGKAGRTKTAAIASSAAASC